MTGWGDGRQLRRAPWPAPVRLALVLALSTLGPLGLTLGEARAQPPADEEPAQPGEDGPAPAPGEEVRTPSTTAREAGPDGAAGDPEGTPPDDTVAEDSQDRANLDLASHRAEHAELRARVRELEEDLRRSQTERRGADDPQVPRAFAASLALAALVVTGIIGVITFQRRRSKPGRAQRDGGGEDAGEPAASREADSKTATGGAAETPPKAPPGPGATAPAGLAARPDHPRPTAPDVEERLQLLERGRRELVDGMRRLEAKLDERLDRFVNTYGAPVPASVASAETSPQARTASSSAARQEADAEAVVLGLLESSQRELEQRIGQGLAGLEERLRRLEAAPTAAPPSVAELPFAGLLAAERGLLQRSWKPFAENHSDLVDLARQFGRDASGEPARVERSLIDRLLGLPKALTEAPELQRSASGVLAPLREYFSRLHRLSMSADLVREGGLQPAERDADPASRVAAAESGLLRLVEQPRPTRSPAALDAKTRERFEAEVLRIRDGLQLLTLLQTTDLADRIRSFNLKSWIRGDFVRFADELIRARQRGPAPGLEVAWEIIREALAHAGLQPVEIELGKTRFDSKVHIGRSDAHERDAQDGVIVGVVRNGFRDVLSEKYFQRPEVVVNRV